jgi:hypothetical protein
VSFWIVFLAGQPRPGGDVPTAGRVTAGWVFGLGFVFIACYVSIYVCGRPRFLVPPPLRSGAVALQSGRRGRGVLPGSDQAGGADEAPVDTALQPGETLMARIIANRVQGGRAFGGHVMVTSSRLVFEPVALSHANGGASWEIPLAQVAGADVAPAAGTPGPPNGGTG